MFGASTDKRHCQLLLRLLEIIDGDYIDRRHRTAESNYTTMHQMSTKGVESRNMGLEGMGSLQSPHRSFGCAERGAAIVSHASYETLL